MEYDSATRRKSYLYNIDEVEGIMPSWAERDKVVRDHFSVDSVKTILTETESGVVVPRH